MANNTTIKKTTGKNSTVKPQVNKDKTIPNTTVETNSVVAKNSKKTYKPDDLIPCRSIIAGQLGMVGLKSEINYEWHGRNDITEVEYQDLVAAIRNKKRHIKEPYFIIEDEAFLAEFPEVQKIYGSMYSMEDLREVFDYDADIMKTIINSLPNGAKESIKNIASSLISSGMLDSISKIKALDEIFDTNFMLMTELYK